MDTFPKFARLYNKEGPIVRVMSDDGTDAKIFSVVSWDGVSTLLDFSNPLVIDSKQLFYAELEGKDEAYIKTLPLPRTPRSGLDLYPHFKREEGFPVKRGGARKSRKAKKARKSKKARKGRNARKTRKH